MTQFGLDFSEEGCRENVLLLASRAREMKSRVEIDMESSEYTDRTLRIVSTNPGPHPGCVRAVIQAYLYRSEDDIAPAFCRRAFRSGSAKEPTGRDRKLRSRRKADVDANYIKLAKLLLDQGTYPAIASHDENIVREALRYSTERKIAPDRFEFQMLYGIRRDLQRESSRRDIDSGCTCRMEMPGIRIL